jgi:hypothetical protein
LDLGTLSIDSFEHHGIEHVFKDADSTLPRNEFSLQLKSMQVVVAKAHKPWRAYVEIEPFDSGALKSDIPPIHEFPLSHATADEMNRRLKIETHEGTNFMFTLKLKFI